MCVSWYALQKILHSCSWGKGPVGRSAKKPAYISSVSKVLNVWVKTLDLLSPALPGCGCALGFVSGGTERVPLEMGFVLVSLLVSPVGFCQQEAPFGLTHRSPRNVWKEEKVPAGYGWWVLCQGVFWWDTLSMAKVGCSIGMAEHPNLEQARDRAQTEDFGVTCQL